MKKLILVLYWGGRIQILLNACLSMTLCNASYFGTEDVLNTSPYSLGLSWGVHTIVPVLIIVIINVYQISELIPYYIFYKYRYLIPVKIIFYSAIFFINIYYIFSSEEPHISFSTFEIYRYFILPITTLALGYLYHRLSKKESKIY